MTIIIIRRFSSFFVPLFFFFSQALYAQDLGQQQISLPSFDIVKFDIDGNRLFSNDELNTVIASYLGKEKTFSDVQEAVLELERIYRDKGYEGVHVFVPEQEIVGGVIRIKIIEGRIQKIDVSNNLFHDKDNILKGLPALQSGDVPRPRDISDNLQLSNENPSKHVEVVFIPGKEQGDVNANVRVTDESPHSLNAYYDNSGSKATGQHRVGLSYQHNNVFNLDHSFSASYTTAPDSPDGVKLDVYSLGYRIPVYSLSSSIDFLYAHSSTNIPSSSPSLAGMLGINGKGDIYSARWNWLLPRQGEYSSKFIFALEAHDMGNSCKTSGGAILNGVAGCEDYRTLPASITYVGRLNQIKRDLSLFAGLTTNLDGSSKERYDLVSGNRDAKRNFVIFKAGASWHQALPHEFQLRVSGNGQVSPHRLVPTEQFGLTGIGSVRGFNERMIAVDSGYAVQTELYSPDLAGYLSIPGGLRTLAFFDFGQGRNPQAAAESRFSVSSAGVGLRYNYAKNLSWRLDLARVIDSFSYERNGPNQDEQYRVHFGANIGF